MQKTTHSFNMGRRLGSAAVFLCFWIWLLLPEIGSASITVDGRPDEPAWSSAQKFDDFVVVDPLSLDTPKVSTAAWVLPLPEGLAVAFICEQPPEGPRARAGGPAGGRGGLGSRGVLGQVFARQERVRRRTGLSPIYMMLHRI
jgi:hypothetical protein